MNKTLLETQKKFVHWLCGWLCIGIFAVMLVSCSPLGRDDSDPGQWGARSNLAIHTDSLTGCQYLAVSNGGLTPRVDSQQRHLGCK